MHSTLYKHVFTNALRRSSRPGGVGLTSVSRLLHDCTRLHQAKRSLDSNEHLDSSLHWTADTPHLTNRRDEALHNAGPYTSNRAKQTFAAFDLTDRVYIVMGGARGIGIAMAEALAEAGGEVHCLDHQDAPSEEFYKAAEQMDRAPGAGSLHYKTVDITHRQSLDKTVGTISEKHKRLDGLVAAAGVVQVAPAIDYEMENAKKLMDVNLLGMLSTADACASAMMKYKSRGSICLIASMSGMIANKGMLSSMYNSSKAGVIQLARNLSMEWSRVQADGSGGIRVNSLSPGHVVTPMVMQTLKQAPGAREVWEAENMMGRLGEPSEFRGAALFLLGNASSFMTGSNLIMDGGHTAW